MKLKSPPLSALRAQAVSSRPAKEGEDGIESASESEIKPDVPVARFRSQKTMVAFADSFLGNNDGVLQEQELLDYTKRFGDKVHLHFGIERMATELGMVTTLSNGRISVRPRNALDVRVHKDVSMLEKYEAIRIADRVCTRVGSAPEPVFNLLKAKLATMPFAVLQEFERRGCRIKIAGLATEAFPELAGVRPRGYPPGATWENAGGGYKSDEKTVFLSTKNAGMRIFKTLHHEVGHAFERTHSDDFSQHYQLDLPKLVENKETYFTQPGEAGLSEAFAETFARFLLNPDVLQREYPNLFAFWEAHAKTDWKDLVR